MNLEQINKQRCEEPLSLKLCAQQAFADRQAKLIRHPKWPVQNWYNDENFCRAYNTATALHIENQRLRAEVKALSEADGLPTRAALYVHAIKTIAELRKEHKAELTFVVEDDHAIMYAGTEFAKARNVILGLNTIEVWRSGTWLGTVAFDGTWLFKTPDCDCPDLEGDCLDKSEDHTPYESHDAWQRGE